MPKVYATPHSRAAWEKLPQAKRGFKSYDRYRQWWNSNVAPNFTVSDDPFAPIPFGAQKAIATQTIQSQINPLIQQFQDSITRRSREGSAQINQATNRFVGAVQPFADNLGSVYDTSIEGFKGVNQALIDQAAAQGQNVSNLLAGMIPEKDAAGAVGAAGTLAQGIGGERLAQGSATLGQLYGARAADVAYGEKMPTYARAFGTEALQDFQKRLNLDQEEGLSELRSRVPGLVASTLDSMRKEELDKAIARKGFEMDQEKMKVASQPAAPDYSWLEGPANRKYVIDPATGQTYDNPNYTPPSARGTSGGKMNTTGITQTKNTAQKLHDDMMAMFTTQSGALTLDNPKYTTKTAAGRTARTALVARTREKARAAVIGNLRAYYPQATEKWLNQQAAAILYATGWPKAAADLMGVDYKGQAPSGVQTLASGSPGGQTGGGPAIEDQRGGKPTAATPTPQQPNRPTQRSGYLSPDRQAQADAERARVDAEIQRSYERERRVDKAYEGAFGEARRLAGMGNVSRREARRQVVAALQRNLPRYPYKKIVALTEMIMRDAYGNTLYGNR